MLPSSSSLAKLVKACYTSGNFLPLSELTTKHERLKCYGTVIKFSNLAHLLNSHKSIITEFCSQNHNEFHIHSVDFNTTVSLVNISFSQISSLRATPWRWFRRYLTSVSQQGLNLYGEPFDQNPQSCIEPNSGMQFMSYMLLIEYYFFLTSLIKFDRTKGTLALPLLALFLYSSSS